MTNRIHNIVNGSSVDNQNPDSYGKGDNRKPKVKKRKYKRREDIPTSVSTTSIKTEFTKDVVKPISSTLIPAKDNEVLPSGKAVPWSPDDVVKFLNDIGCGEFSSPFKDHQIDGQALLLLSQADLVRHLKLKLGPALRIYSEISKL